MTSEDSNRCRFYQRGHLVLLLLQGICRTSSSCRSNTTSRAGRKGAAKFNLPHCGYLGWDHWSHSLEHTYQWSLYSRTWDLRFPRSPPRLFFGYFFILIMKFFKTFQAQFDACLKECLAICYPLTYRVSTIFFLHPFSNFVDQYAPHLCLFFLVGNAKKNRFIFFLGRNFFWTARQILGWISWCKRSTIVL